MAKSVIIFILILLVLVEGGFILYSSGVLKTFLGSNTEIANNPSSNNPLINFQALPIQGKITAESGKTLTFKNVKGTTGELTLADNFSISPPTENNKIILNKEAILNLQDSGNGNYVVNSILYIPIQQINPNTSTSSATMPISNPNTPAFSPPPTPENIVPKPSLSPSIKP